VVDKIYLGNGVIDSSLQGRNSPGPKYRSEINSFGYELKFAKERREQSLLARQKLKSESSEQKSPTRKKPKKKEVVIQGELKSSPGPVYYPKVHMLSKMKREPGFKFGTQKRTEKPQIADTPGPGQYSVIEAYGKISKPTSLRTHSSIW
jgi:hypothetical protein